MNTTSSTITAATTAANIINNNFEPIQLTSINNNNNNQNNNNNNEEEHPPMIGLPNLKGKALIRPIAFRPTPGPNSGASTPTNGPLGSYVRPGSSNGNNESLVPIVGLLARASPAQGPFNVPVPQAQSTQQNGNSSTSEGFAPGHPLVKDGRRHYGSSQELHVAAPISTNPAFNKFNSLDRRALNKRQTGNNGLLKLATPTSTSGPESLPAVRPSDFQSKINQFNKEPERRHSSYDPAGSNKTRVSCRSGSSQPAAGQSQAGQQAASASININGLPDPFSGGLTGSSNRINPSSVYSSQESLHRGSGTPLRPNSSTGSTRGGAGTPQFQNLSGTIRTSANGLIPSSTATTPLTNNQNNSNQNNSEQIRTNQNNSAASRSTLTSLYHSSGSNSTPSIGMAAVSSTTNQQDMNQTPSPSDSAVGDLETMLKEKDTEINYLRETMEQNEQVIFKVYEEKEKMWERELRKIKGLYDNRLRASQQKSSKMEQALTNQTYQLQNEKRRLERDLEEIKRQKEEQDDENERLRQEVASLRKLLEKSGQKEETKLETNEKDESRDAENPDEEITKSTTSLLPEKITANSENSPEAEIKELRNQLSQLKEELNKKETEQAELKQQEQSKFTSKDHQIDILNKDLAQLALAVKELKTEASETKETFETEKTHWLDEKEKVIRYQKQLQLNYVQMYKRNKTLEAEIEILNKSIEDLTSQLAMAKATPPEPLPAPPATAKTQSRLQKTGNSVRARLFKMSLHSESQC